MEVIKSFNINLKNQSVVTIGNFDGIHIGHQKLIETVKSYSNKENLTSVIFSFFPHPVSFFSKNEKFYTIFSEEEKILEIQKFDIDLLVQCPFNQEFANLEPEEFAKILFKNLNCKVLIVGEDYYFGKNKKGNYNLLKKIGEEYNAKVIKIEHIKLKNQTEKVSSSKIKEYILQKDISTVNTYLNKSYYVYGEVIDGNKLGKTIGFPTANMLPPENKILLPDGVYITQVEYNSNIYNSITNIGTNPTVFGDKRTIETFIFDFNKDIYNEKIKVMFYKNIRNQKKFSGIDELKIQINKDVQFAKDFFKNNMENIKKCLEN